jgi:hypothetical protein
VSSADVFRALAVVCEDASPASARVAGALGLPGPPDAAAHTDLFCLQLPPYASIHLGPEGMLGGGERDRVAGTWRALGFTPPGEPDHLAALLGLYAALVDAEADAADPARRVLRREARRALLWEHLLSWVPGYARAAGGIAAPDYRIWARTLVAALLAEAEQLDLPEARSGHRLPAPLRDAPPPVSAAPENLDAFLAEVLVPVRSGIVMTHRDLAGAARSLGLGLRLGERRFVLSALAGQEPAAVCGWLAGHARVWTEHHRRLVPSLGAVAGFWQVRSEAVARQLEAAADAADSAVIARAGTARLGASDGHSRHSRGIAHGGVALPGGPWC